MSKIFSDSELDSILDSSVEMIEDFYEHLTEFASQIEEIIKKLHISMVNFEKLKEQEGVYDPTRSLSNTNIFDLCKNGYKNGVVFYKIINEMEEMNPLKVNYYNLIGFDAQFTQKDYPNVTETGADKLLKKYGLEYPDWFYIDEMNNIVLRDKEKVSYKHQLLQSKIEAMFNAGVITQLERDILLLTIEYYAEIALFDYELEEKKERKAKTPTA